MPNRAKQQRMKRRLWAMQTQGTLKAMLNYAARLQSTVIKREFQESQRIYNQVFAASDAHMRAMVSSKGWQIPSYLR